MAFLEFLKIKITHKISQQRKKLKINFMEFRLIYFKNVTQSDGRIMHFLVDKYIPY